MRNQIKLIVLALLVQNFLHKLNKLLLIDKIQKNLSNLITWTCSIMKPPKIWVQVLSCHCSGRLQYTP